MGIFYTYVYLRSSGRTFPVGTPYYIGKGNRNRAYRRDHSVVTPRDRRFILIVADGLSNEEAFAYEIALIWWYGRIDVGTGCLRNLTDGGEGFAGRLVSDTTRHKLSVAHKGKRKPPMSEETRREISEGNIRRFTDPEERRKSSEAAKRRPPMSDDNRRKISDGLFEAARRKKARNILVDTA